MSDACDGLLVYKPLASSRSALAVAMLGAMVCCSSSLADETVQVCGSYANNVFAASSVAGIATTGQCPAPSYNGGGFGLFNNGTTTSGQAGRWQTTTPAGLELVGVTAEQIVSVGVNDGGDYGGGFYWAGGGPETNDQTPSSLGMAFASAVELLRDAARVRKRYMHSSRAAGRRRLLALRPRDERSWFQRAEWAVADDGVDQGDMAVCCVGRLAVRAVFAVRETERAADQTRRRPGRTSRHGISAQRRRSASRSTRAGTVRARCRSR